MIRLQIAVMAFIWRLDRSCSARHTCSNIKTTSSFYLFWDHDHFVAGSVMNSYKVLTYRFLIKNVFRKQSGHALRRHASSLSVPPDIYDVVCVGGGPAGLSLLAGLREYFNLYE